MAVVKVEVKTTTEESMTLDAEQLVETLKYHFGKDWEVRFKISGYDEYLDKVILTRTTVTVEDVS